MKRCSKIPSLFDLHSDLPSVVLRKEKSAVNFDTKFTRHIQTVAFYIPENEPLPYLYYKKMLSVFKEQNTVPINRLSDFKTVLLSVEGGAAFEDNLNRIYEFYNDKIRTVSLTWNHDNSLAGGAFGEGSLTQKGGSAIAILNELNIVLDISHLNEKSAVKAAEKAEFLIASHSNSKSVFNHKRNLSDDLLKLIRDKNGLVGINFYPEFLGDGDVFEAIYRQISYMLSLGLEKNIAIGSDFDGAEMDPKLKDTEDVLSLFSYLSENFDDKKLIDGIFFENARRFYQKLFDKRT